jgi:hypothetical protein
MFPQSNPDTCQSFYIEATQFLQGRFPSLAGQYVYIWMDGRMYSSTLDGFVFPVIRMNDFLKL